MGNESLDEKDAKIARLETEKQDLEDELESQRERYIRQVKKAESAQSDVIHLNDTIRELQGKLEALKHAPSSVDEDAFKAKLNDLSIELKSKDAKIAELEATLQHSQTSSTDSKEVANLKAAVETLKGYLTNAKKMVLSARETEKKYQGELAALEKQIVSLKSELESAKTALSSAQSEKSSLQSELESVKSELTTLQANASSSVSMEDYTNLQSMLTDVSNERDNLKEELASFKKKLGSLLN